MAVGETAGLIDVISITIAVPVVDSINHLLSSCARFNVLPLAKRTFSLAQFFFSLRKQQLCFFQFSIARAISSPVFYVGFVVRNSRFGVLDGINRCLPAVAIVCLVNIVPLFNQFNSVLCSLEGFSEVLFPVRTSGVIQFFLGAGKDFSSVSQFILMNTISLHLLNIGFEI